MTTFALVLAAAPAQAQQLAPSGLTMRDYAATTFASAPAPVHPRLVGAAHGALLGVVIGALVGVAAATIVSGGYGTDVGATFASLAAFGAGVGVISGAVLGAAAPE